MKDKSPKNKQGRILKSELHAVSTAPLELIESRLHNITDKQIDIHTTYIDDDRIGFELHYIREGRVNALVYGTLQRWEGTHTRLDADSRTFIRGDWLNYIVPAGLFLLISGCSMSFWYNYNRYQLWETGQFYWTFSAVFSVLLALGIMRWLPDIVFFREAQFQATSDVDYLMQAIANTLADTVNDSSYPMLEFDGSDDALERLLKQHPAKMRVGHDGELL